VKKAGSKLIKKTSSDSPVRFWGSELNTGDLRRIWVKKDERNRV